MDEKGGERDKKVGFSDWMGSDSEPEDKKDFDKIFAEDKFSKRDKKSQLLLQLQKTYKGDDRFLLNKDFAADDTDKLPSNMLGALSTREYQDLIASKPKKPKDASDPSAKEPILDVAP